MLGTMNLAEFDYEQIILKENGKEPIFKGWKAPEDVVQRLLARGRNNVGILLTDIVVADVDGKDGEDLARELGIPRIEACTIACTSAGSVLWICLFSKAGDLGFESTSAPVHPSFVRGDFA